MADPVNNNGKFSTRVKVLGTIFLIAQLLLAVSNYGPHEIPGLSLLFDEPWIPAEEVSLQQAMYGETPAFSFEDITEFSGLDSFYRAKVNSENPSYLEVMSGGVAVGDVNEDEFEDIFFISMPSLEEKPQKEASRSTLYRNNGDGTFDDITEDAGLSDLKGYPQGALFFDFNNNGRQDLYVASYGGGQLFRNDGGEFTEITDEAGLNMEGLCGEHPCYGSTAAASDYNRDGLTDLYIVNNVDWEIENPSHYGERRLFPAFFDAQESFLFKNNGDGTFSNVTEEAGVNNEEGKGLSAIWFDYNNDNWPDLYIANDLSRNKLYLNRGDGTFTDIAASAELDEVKSSMGLAAADYNESGRIDLAVTNLEGSYISLFQNIDDLRFDYATHYAGLNPSRRSSGWGVEFVDLNLDGNLDLVMAAGPVWDPEPTDAENLFFENMGEGQFEDRTLSAGSFDNRDVSRGLAVIDITNNGRPDLVISNIDGGHPQLLLNTTSNQNHWLKLTLEGTESNRDAIGAKVQLNRTDGKTIYQEVKAGGSYQSSSSKSLFFGLSNSEVQQLTIRWPSGLRQVLEEVPVDTVLHITEERSELSDKL
ncbi:CRTAC1 family protein [Aliifodinibius sp. S!AR15-10]|uniref:CRTAC1 family protein n=1 Tax=Aliifodinibius sp. S!AR15-10 TaxID=2950437 RepID=UPI002859DF24|nr:CRTAC1 family protein [Aliifodinibius sp. S!AR15-10]MDR8390755.1 CRTAC1 family protein [Aliifodinibius sp. S!AR15-10]